MHKYKLILILVLGGLFSCSSEKATNSSSSSKGESQGEEKVKKEEVTADLTEYSNEVIDPKTIDQIDFSKINYDTLTLEQARILRNYFAAKQGYLFMKAELRGYFNQTDWYANKMYDRWEKEDYGEEVPPLSYSDEEQKIIDKLIAQEEKLKSQLYGEKNGIIVPNLNGLANGFQFTGMTPEFINGLQEKGFVISEASHEQLFHVYEKNDYGQIPNYITTDVFLQLYHMYFGYLLKRLEKEQFIPTITKMTKELYQRSEKLHQEGNKHGGFLMTYYAIAHNIISGNNLPVPDSYAQVLEDEVSKINAAEDALSPYLGYNSVNFPYSLFKPRGHYTRDEAFKKYFKTMMWLQYTPFCQDEKKQFDKAVLMAGLLKGADGDPSLMKDYKSVFEPIVYLIGVPDNLSVMDMMEILDDRTLHAYGEALDFSKEISKHLDVVKQDRNKIKPKQEVTCRDKINLMPQRYLADNEILLEMVDADNDPTKRAYPMGLDIMAAFGSQAAEDILLKELKEGEKWGKYPAILAAMQKKFKNMDWNASVYNKWIESLVVLQDEFKDGPYYMQNNFWKKKNVNTALASWAELKHDAILYAEQPMVAECGGGGPPEPYTVGYVEPNVPFWKKQLELIELTSSMLEDHNLHSEETKEMTNEIKEMAEFLLQVSEKEIKGEKLTNEEYNTIEVMGSNIEYLTLHLVEPDKYLDSWYDVQGPDKKVAIVADIFTSNGMNNPEKGILHVATGEVNEIFVVVEIEGHFYLTKGAVFSYHEFPRPMGTRLTDEEWQKMLEKGRGPGIPSWMDELIIEDKNKPVNNEKIYYSSGC